MAKAIRILALLVLSLLILFPMLYALSTSFFTPQDFTAAEAKLLPSSLSFRNYSLAMGHRYFGRYIFNSFATASLTALLRIMITSLAAFSFTHLRFRGKRALMIILLSTLFIPQDALLYENYATTVRLGLIDSYLGIILPSLFSASAMLLLCGAYSSEEWDIYNAARIDGAGDIKYISSILMPLSAPIVSTIFIQTFISSFNSYLWPLLVTTRPRMRTVQVGITMLGFAEQGELGAQAAAIMLITIPFLLLLGVGRKTIMESLSGGRSLK